MLVKIKLIWNKIKKDKKYWRRLKGVLLIILVVIFIGVINKKKELNYNDYEEMLRLTKMSKSQLITFGYKENDILKIQEFERNYHNFMFLLEQYNISCYQFLGYGNRQLNTLPNKDLLNGSSEYLVETDGLYCETTITDLGTESKRNVARLIINFEWKEYSPDQKQYIYINFPNYTLVNTFSLLIFENTQNSEDVVYKMCEADPSVFSGQFCAEISVQRGGPYILKTGMIILDIRADILDVGVPLDLTTQYTIKEWNGKTEILSQQIIIKDRIAGDGLFAW